MTPAPVPVREDLRLRALRNLRLLDTPSEERFDYIVEYAAALFEVPIVLITLVDGDRQWFKAKVGITASETARDISFCGHAIVEPDILIVPDALRDPRFADNPMVIGEPYVRFYAGAPLNLPNGEAVGTLCLVDTIPRKFHDVHRLLLLSLRRMVIDELSSSPVADA